MANDDAEDRGNYVLDPESTVEMVRLIDQDRMLTREMGGTLPEIANTVELQTLLDVACGPGGWTLDVAFEHQECDVIGIDISQKMIAYANACARTQQLENVSFELMNILRPFEFDDASFDLVNARLLIGVLNRDAWDPFLDECTRVLRPGGTLRLTEIIDGGLTNSVAYEQSRFLTYQALWRAGYGFSPDGRSFGIAPLFTRWLSTRSYQEIRLTPHAIDVSAGSNAWMNFFHNIEVAMSAGQEVFVKTGVATREEIATVYQNTLREVQEESFCGLWNMLTVTGTKPR